MYVSGFRSALPAAIVALACAPLFAGEWRRFRGNDGSGTSDAKELPTKWSEKEGIAWKTELPGAGTSSPIVTGGKILVTCYSGYGQGRGNLGEMSKLRRHVVCVDEKSGKILWDRSIESREGEPAYRGIGVPNHGYASSTSATDGTNVYSYFGRSGVVAHDLAGKELWRAQVHDDPGTHNFGSASSLVLAGDLVVVPASVECEAIVAYDKKTGAEAWRAPAEGYRSWWSTPVVIQAGGTQELVFQVPDEIWGLNAKNGKLRWYAETYSARSLSPSAVHVDGVIYAIAGRQGGCIAIKAGGRKDVTKSHVLWKERYGSYVTSPVVVGGLVFWADDRGIAYCLNAKTGEEVYRERLEGAGSIYASMLAGAGKLYVVTRRNGTFVLPAEPKFEVLAHNELAEGQGDFNACPAVSGDRLILRSDRNLYAIGK